MKNFFKLKYFLLKNFNNQTIYITIISNSPSNFFIENAQIKIEKNIINILKDNLVILSINFKKVINFKSSNFRIVIYFSDKQIEIET